MEEEDWGFTNDIYQSFFQMNFEWPCLSFDVIQDTLGASRRTFPHTAYFVSATQAESEDENQLLVTKISELQYTKNDGTAEEDLPDPKIRVCGNFHPSCANRVRCMPQNTNVVATWTESAGVCIWDIKDAINASNTDSGDGAVNLLHECPADDEGYGLAWSKIQQGLLAYGDVNGIIQLWKQDGSSFRQLSQFPAHADSVEDIVFSPQDDGIFATCSSDGYVCIWDNRDLKAPILKFQGRNLEKDPEANPADKIDINVLDWNGIQKTLIATGSDDGQINVWDIRNASDENGPAFSIDYHQDAITSIEWNPNDETELAASSEDGRVTVWDISVEAFDPEDREEGIPDQMMFEHPIAEPKELHYHPQIPGLIAVTGETFDVFIPDIVEDADAQEDGTPAPETN
ncbi:ribosome assembly protein RRB1, putative [Trichomonas vaginalis G3]|uniref:Glutamate-rich WD repeat-containing protein 1 n=1 Tax=Trichomonas vaginalis (strain ATCC PRA-98 / G3) TaxID=412133 RepID=A2DSI5_TRIV3|nr:chromatin disassembly [Trichomonas vaginalis G3]EAY16565.1 ribosome assembly protein RRB1, putative [Trichomonas vaginalis G3]KAI5532934.1 chromatin disassembly [Trichomonas vaginalis G3]|eukprot:XP_001328788.1 ribosome assembly protein RRB1 [Trichomonas vaginalis G3]